jgi:hypothetical protein
MQSPLRWTCSRFFTVIIDVANFNDLRWDRAGLAEKIAPQDARRVGDTARGNLAGR